VAGEAGLGKPTDFEKYLFAVDLGSHCKQWRAKSLFAPFFSPAHEMLGLLLN
jgi:hypothetical protein